ncbi:MAG TPA: hypothetical protein VMU01_02485 [Rhizomicrobium sp.]|nr:hypothetical protein [Rhizomicrobium sp.]
MPYKSEADRKWVQVFTAGAAGSAPGQQPDPETELAIRWQSEIKADLALKAVLLGQARKDVERNKDMMRASLQFDIEVKGRKLPTLGKGGDATQGFDTAETRDITTAPSAETVKQAHLAMEMLVRQKDLLIEKKTMRSRLEKGVIVQEEVPLFDPREVMRELYTPLVRELVIPDNFIEAKYSETQEMVDGSNDAFLKELEGFTEPDALVEGLDKAKQVFDLATSITKAVTSNIDAVKDLSGQVIDLAKTIVDTGLDASSALVGKADPRAAVPKFAGGVSNAVGGLLTLVTGNKELGATFTKAVNGAITGGTMLAALSKQPEPDFEGFIDGIVTSVEKGFAEAAGRVKDEKDKVIVEGVGSAITAGARNLIEANKKNIVLDIKKGNWGAVTASVSGILCNLGGTAMDITASARKLDKDDDQQKEIDEKAEKLKALLEGGEKSAALGEAVQEKLKAHREELEKQAAAWKKQDEAPGEKKLSKEDADKVNEKLTKELEEQRKLLDQLGSSGKDPDLKSIAELIEKMKKDRAIMSAAIAVGSAGFSVAEKFLQGFPGASLASFLTNLASAVQRAIHMRKWMDANQDAISAVSPYRTAIENFVKNQSEQFAQASIQAALNLLQAGASIAGMAVPIGHVIAAGATVAASTEELIYKFAKERALKVAWQTTKDALDNPGNRKLALIARRLNPTLAKYTIAYGAVVKKDVVAITAMNRCGLTRETLAAKDANIAQVKKYLEETYPDDGKAIGSYEGATDWKKELPKAALDVTNWSLAWSVCKKQAPELSSANPRPVVAQLKLIGQIEARLRGKPTEADYDALGKALDALGTAIAALLPGKADVGAVLKAYADLAQVRAAEAENARAEAFDLAA